VKDARLGEPAGGQFRHAIPCEAILLASLPKLLLDFLQLRPLAVAPSLPLKLAVSSAGSTADVGEAQEREGFRSAEPAPRASGRRMASELDHAGDAALFAAIVHPKPRNSYYFVFYSERLDAMWIMSSEQFIAEAVQNKSGENAGKRSIRFNGKMTDKATGKKIEYPKERYEKSDFSVFRHVTGLVVAPTTDAVQC
jgi:hypothetical protein